MLASIKITELNNSYLCEKDKFNFCVDVELNKEMNKKFINEKTNQWNCDLGLPCSKQ